MNWEALSAIGEWIGLVIVIVSLIYLARQVKQANHEIKLLGIQARGDTAIGLLAPIVNDPEIARLLLKMGHARYGDFGLDEVEAQRIGAWCHIWFQVQQANHYLLPEGTHDEVIHYFATTGGFAEFWDKNKSIYDKEFVARVEKLRTEGLASNGNPDDVFTSTV